MSSSLTYLWYTVTFQEAVTDKNLDKSELAQRVGFDESRISDEEQIVCMDEDGKTFSFVADLPQIDFKNDDRTIRGPFANPKIEPFL